MISIQPRTLGSISDRRLQRLKGLLVGEELEIVRYISPTGVRWPSGHRCDHLLHEVDMGVELVFKTGLTLRVSWETPGSDEGLVIELNEESPIPGDRLGDSLDVTNSDEWLPYLRQVVTGIAVAFYSHDEEPSDRPWSLRVEFVGSKSVTVALGEVADNQLGYMPDNLVVIFDDAIARTFKVATAYSTAWGQTV